MFADGSNYLSSGQRDTHPDPDTHPDTDAHSQADADSHRHAHPYADRSEPRQGTHSGGRDDRSSG
ncbi:hypothetical protein BH09ACT6_BH09ACT6_02860 [soil metagenome]